MGRAVVTREVRLEVLAWMEETGSSSAAAMKHFRAEGYEGIPGAASIRRWKQEEGRRDQGLPTAKPRKAAVAARERDKLERETFRENRKAKDRARTRAKSKGRFVHLDIEDLGPETRGQLRRIAQKLLDYCEGVADEVLTEGDEALLTIAEASGVSEKTVDYFRMTLERARWKPGEVKNAMIALGILIDKVPEILSLDDRIEGREEDSKATTGEAAVARLQEALARAHGTQPSTDQEEPAKLSPATHERRTA